MSPVSTEPRSMGNRMKKQRKTESLTALASIAVPLVTSVIIHIVPQGRVAYWSESKGSL